MNCNGWIQRFYFGPVFTPVDTTFTVFNFDCMDDEPQDCSGQPNGPDQVANPCETYPGSGVFGLWAPGCWCDSIGSSTPDCNGVLAGNDLPGSPCDDGDTTTFQDTWHPNCACFGVSMWTPYSLHVSGTVTGASSPWPYVICELVPFSNVVAPIDSITGAYEMTVPCGLGVNPGDTIPYSVGYDYVECSPAEFGYFVVSAVDSVQYIHVDFEPCTPSTYVDCLGTQNGPDVPGTPCDDQDPATINDMWDASCNCVGGVLTPCEANFWVLQAVTFDSLNQTTTPIPYELWIWNLSSGGSGTYTTFWNFGDGSSSTAQFPTHTYSGNGPYLLCLTIDDGAGCTSTYCDSVSIDGNGLYTGMLGGGSDRQNGFTVSIRAPQTTGLTEQSVADGIATWPNPVADELNIALTNALSGTADVTVLDLNGRVVMADRRMLANGRNQLLLQTSTLAPGLYTVRIGNADHSVSQRFVKVN